MDGFTGTSVVIDLDRRMFVILLSNRMPAAVGAGRNVCGGATREKMRHMQEMPVP